MKKRLLKLLLGLALFLCLTLAVSPVSIAAEEGSGTETFDVDEVIDDFVEQLPPGMEELGEDGGALSAIGFEAILSELTAALTGGVGRVSGFFLLIMGASVLMAAAATFDGELSAICRVGVVSVSSVAVFSAIYPLVSDVSRSLGELCTFFNGVYPVMLGITAMGGGASVTAAHSASMGLTLQICGGLSLCLSGLVGAIFALGVASSLGGGGVDSVSRRISLIFTRGMGILTAVMGGMLSLQTLLSSLSDSAVMRAVKYSASGMIPVVGNAVAGALATVGGGLAYAKGIVGGGAIAVVVGMVLAPLVTLLLYKLCFSAASVFLEFCSAKDGAACIGAMSAALDALISVYVTSSVCFVLQTVLFIMGGGGL